VEDKFLKYLCERSLENYLFIFGFIFGIGAYSFWRPIENILKIEEEGQAFYVCIAVAFFFYTLAFLVVKYKTWKWFPMFVTSVCFSRIYVEMNPEISREYQFVDYIIFLLTEGTIFFYWLKYKWNKFYKNKDETIKEL